MSGVTGPSGHSHRVSETRLERMGGVRMPWMPKRGKLPPAPTRGKLTPPAPASTDKSAGSAAPKTKKPRGRFSKFCSSVMNTLSSAKRSIGKSLAMISDKAGSSLWKKVLGGAAGLLVSATAAAVGCCCGVGSWRLRGDECFFYL